jgi:hypothetical protein
MRIHLAQQAEHSCSSLPFARAEITAHVLVEHIGVPQRDTVMPITGSHIFARCDLNHLAYVQERLPDCAGIAVARGIRAAASAVESAARSRDSDPKVRRRSVEATGYFCSKKFSARADAANPGPRKHQVQQESVWLFHIATRCRNGALPLRAALREPRAPFVHALAG